MSSQDFAGQPLSALVESFLSGNVAARDIAESVLARVARAEPFNPVATLDAAGARAQADALDTRRKNGAGKFGSLAAVPVSAKDLILTKGLRTAFASLTMKDNVPAEDAAAIAQWRAADAVLFAKTTTPEFGHKVLTDSRLHGVTRNPWNREHTSGGSSGGAAVAIACGLGPIAMTTDGAGSGRIPAACCGVYGLKATLGRVPHEKAPDQFGQLTYLGVMARHPVDLGHGLAAMSRGDAMDPWTAAIGREAFAWPQPPTNPIAGKRITVIRRFTGGYLDPEVEARLNAAIAFLEKSGARIREIDGRDVDWKLDVARIILRANQIERFSEILRTRGNELDESFIKTLKEGEAIDAVQLRQALLDRSAAFRSVQRLLGKADLLLTPTVATPAPLATQDQFKPLVVDGKPIGDLRAAWYTYTIPFNMTGHPAISIPFGRSKAGLPIGIHFVAPWFAEAHLIQLAQVFDTETGASQEFPPGLAP